MILWVLFGYLVIMNGLGGVMMGQDKSSARIRTAESRIPESQLLFIAILGGALGVYISMFLFRHKTKKPIFLIGLPLLILQQLLLLYLSFPYFTDFFTQ